MKMTVQELGKKASWVRYQVLETAVPIGRGHLGGAFSCTDILVAIYYGDILRFDPRNPNWDKRDRFILSKGHTCTPLYVILADLGFFPFLELKSYRRDGSLLGGYPDTSTPGIELDTGSLGHGLNVAAGLALSAKINKKDFITVALLGDGECYEGSVWEAANFAGHHQLNNLIAIVDRNWQCVTDFTEDCNRLEPLTDKWMAFNWEVRRVNGHSFEELLDAFKDFRVRKSAKPLAVIADTIKGKGVSFMERNVAWHHGVPKGEELEIARQELRRALK